MPEAIGLDYRFFQRYRYAIVDAERRDEIPESWSALPIAPSFLRGDIERCPLLVDISALRQDARIDLLIRLEEETAAGEDTFISLALACEKPPQQLLVHLREKLVIQQPERERPQQFRYFDPGTFLQLPDILGEKGMSWLLGPIKNVAVPWVGEWCDYSHPCTPGSGLFRISEFIDALSELSIINRVLTQLEDIRNQNEWKQKSREVRIITDFAAEKYGLKARDDVIAFAMHACRWGRNFDRHSIIQNLLAKLASAAPEDELDYRELTAGLREADWEEIALHTEIATPAQGKKS